MSRAPLHALQAIVSLGCVLVPTPKHKPDLGNGTATTYQLSPQKQLPSGLSQQAVCHQGAPDTLQIMMLIRA